MAQDEIRKLLWERIARSLEKITIDVHKLVKLTELAIELAKKLKQDSVPFRGK